MSRIFIFVCLSVLVLSCKLDKGMDVNWVLKSSNNENKYSLQGKVESVYANNNQIFVQFFDRIKCFNKENAEQLWESSIEFSHKPLLFTNELCIVSSKTKIEAYDLISGLKEWVVEEFNSHIVDVYISECSCFVLCQSQLCQIDLSSGNLIETIELNSIGDIGFEDGVILSKNNLILISNKNEYKQIVHYSLAKNTLLWSKDFSCNGYLEISKVIKRQSGIVVIAKNSFSNYRIKVLDEINGNVNWEIKDVNSYCLTNEDKIIFSKGNIVFEHDVKTGINSQKKIFDQSLQFTSLYLKDNKLFCFGSSKMFVLDSESNEAIESFIFKENVKEIVDVNDKNTVLLFENGVIKSLSLDF